MWRTGRASLLFFLILELSPRPGICVAKPYEMLVRKDFFIDLNLPYSVVRNEQVEIRAILYSYVNKKMEVQVDLTYNKKMSSSATEKANLRKLAIMEPMASLVIPFVIVPLEIGNIQIEVKASAKDYYLTDGVVKQLKVVPEGMRIMKNIQSVILEPLRSYGVPGIQVLTIDTVPPNDIVPNTEPETYVSVKERCNQKNAHKERLDSAKRVELACSAGVDYVYECQLEKIEETGDYDVFTMAIKRVIKLGTDDIKDDSRRRFFIHKSCRESVKVLMGRTYIIWGQSEDVWRMKNEVSYVINGGTWFEIVPNNKDCATVRSADCEEIYKFIDHLTLFGCPT